MTEKSFFEGEIPDVSFDLDFDKILNSSMAKPLEDGALDVTGEIGILDALNRLDT